VNEPERYPYAWAIEHGRDYTGERRVTFIRNQGSQDKAFADKRAYELHGAIKVLVEERRTR
jgi:hypothetical protein